MKKVLIGVLLGGLVAVGIGAYLWVGFSYEGRMQKNTFVNGMDFSEKTAEDVQAYYRGEQEKAEIRLRKKDGSAEVFPLKKAGFTITADTDLIDTSRSKSLEWILSYSRKTEYELPLHYSYDREALQQAVHQLACVSGSQVKQPQDAFLDRREDGLYVVVPEEEGNALDEEKVRELLAASMQAGGEDVDLTDCYLSPAITRDDPELNALAETYNSVGGEEITIDFVGAQETVTTEEIVANIKFAESGEVLVSDAWLYDKMEEYADRYNTFYTKREFETTGGETILVGGTDVDTYGFELDQDATRLALQTAIKQKESATIDAVWSNPGIRRAENDVKDDLGGTYVEVSIAEQHLWYYQAGELMMETDVVTGNDSDGRRTPRGLCRVWAKQRDRLLEGEGYNTHVNYWMAFNWVGCGFHDATWRSDFGGSIYKGNGSHGCVNLPYGKAEELYGMLGYDTPVVIY